MDRGFKKCEICNKDESVQIWFPFRSNMDISYRREDLDAEDSIEICFACERRIFRLRRANGEAFSGASTMSEVIKIVNGVN